MEPPPSSDAVSGTIDTTIERARRAEAAIKENGRPVEPSETSAARPVSIADNCARSTDSLASASSSTTTKTMQPYYLSPARLAALRASGLLDSPAEPGFDRLTRIASRVLKAPIALVSLVDHDRQFFKAQVGFEPGSLLAEKRETPISHSFCRHVVDLKKCLVIHDARLHPLVKDNPSVSELGVIAYLGHPISSPSGDLLGSFCVIDTVPRNWSQDDIDLITDLALTVDSEIALNDRAARLVEATEAAVLATRAKDVFLATMSHEIRTPLGAVIGFADLLSDMKDELSEEALEFVEHIKAGGQHLLGLVDDILDQSRLESGALRLESRKFDLKRTMADVQALLNVRASAKDIALLLEFDPKTPVRVVGDEQRLRQILLNIVGNAIKFTHAGSVTMSVSGQPLGPTSSSRFIIKVVDTGIGIPRERLAHIFDRFQQADASTARKYGGSGLGLAISRQLAELMKGTVSAESEEGSGSTFTIEVTLGVVE